MDDFSTLPAGAPLGSFLGATGAFVPFPGFTSGVGLAALGSTGTLVPLVGFVGLFEGFSTLAFTSGAALGAGAFFASGDFLVFSLFLGAADLSGAGFLALGASGLACAVLEAPFFPAPVFFATVAPSEPRVRWRSEPQDSPCGPRMGWGKGNR
ncbi:MAG TPA: hypothetical protein DEB06_01955 [Phycisphaerales bacterium]|nr:hypothetical protein [Phycisphaerales bacterium]